MTNKRTVFGRAVFGRTVSGLSVIGLTALFFVVTAPAGADAADSSTIQPAKLIYAQPFELDTAYHHLWRADRVLVSSGSIIVVEADVDLLRPRQGHQPLLFVGAWTAEPINVGDASGRVVALVPVAVSELGQMPIFYATTGILPEALSEADAESTLAAAIASGMTPPSAEDLALALAAGGASRSLPDFHALRRETADLIERFSPQEVDVVRGLRAPLVPIRSSTSRRSPAALPTEPVNVSTTLTISGLIETELAGGALAGYPGFEYVTAFNAGSPIEVAVDTSRFPQLVGPGDIYVVAAKTRAQWAATPSLIDLTGAVETVRFLAGTIESNTVTADAGTLSGAAGTGLGVGYDVVIDVDQNGELSSGDAIDGFSDKAGLYVVHDLTLPGPLAVTEAIYDGGSFLGQNTFYPTDIATMGQLPLIVVSHGNGHNYLWYDHIGSHMASYGYVVMSHENNTGPGIETASETTLTNTDYLLGNLDTIEGGVLDGHIDTSRITWIGHSRGGEGIARAYDRIFDGNFIPVGYTLDDLALLSSIAPTDFLGPSSANPHAATYHLWVGGADADVSGCASSDIGQSFHLLDRALDARQSISLHGVGHGDFHNGGGSSVASGPCLVGRSDTHTIMRGYLLPLVKHYVEGNVPASDFLWRQWESFRPIGAPLSACVVADLTYRQSGATTFVIDDFETGNATDVSSSGGAVTFDVTDLTEDVMDDGNTTFTDLDTDVMNGMTLAGNGDTSRGIVFTYDSGGGQFLDFELPANQQDLRFFDYLSFRGAQQTRHPLTTAELGDTTFTVTLRDASSGTSSIDFGVYGGGLEEPYQRGGCGAGNGWNNEFETVRIRLSDFLHNSSGLDLSDVASVRFELGPGFGTASGRIGLDQIELTTDTPPIFVDGFESGDTSGWSSTSP